MNSSTTLDYEQFLQTTTTNPICLDLQDVEPDIHELDASIVTDPPTHQPISQEVPTDSNQQLDGPMDHTVYQVVTGDSDIPMSVHPSVSVLPKDDMNDLDRPSMVQEHFTLDQNLQSLDEVSKLVELPNFIPIPRQRFFWEIFQDQIFL